MNAPTIKVEKLPLVVRAGALTQDDSQAEGCAAHMRVSSCEQTVLREAAFESAATVNILVTLVQIRVGFPSGSHLLPYDDYAKRPFSPEQIVVLADVG